MIKRLFLAIASAIRNRVKSLKFFSKILTLLTKLLPLKRLYFGYVAKYFWQIVLAITLMAIVALATSSVAYLVGPIINKVFSQNSQTMLAAVSFGLVGIYIIKTIATYFQQVILRSLCERIITDIRVDVFGKVIHMPIKDIENTQNGKIITIFLNDIQQIGESVRELFVTSIRDVLTVACLVCVVFYNDWLLACVAVIIYPLVFVPMIKIHKAAKKVFLQEQNYLQQLSARIVDAINGIKTIKSYNTEFIEKRRMKKLLLSLVRVSLSYARKATIAAPAVELACGISVALVVFVGGCRIIYGYSDVGHFFSFFAALLMALRPAQSLANLGVKLNACSACLERVFSFTDNLCEEDLKNGFTPDMTNATIAFKNVNFNYKIHSSAVENEDQELQSRTLHNINFEIKPHSKVAFVGLSGSGKSTIVNLLMRLYELNSGTITIGGQDIKNISLAWLRNNIAYIGQDNFLFDDTIRNNIVYGTNGNTFSDETFQQAVHMAQINFVKDLENGINENVGYNGNKFSLGQRQRIAIARAIIKNAPIVVFDEATSALDANTERAIRDEIFNNMKDKTTIMVAHRLSTIVNCDAIYVMEEGKIVEQGTHSQLLKKNGLYAKLWMSLNDDKGAK